MAPIVVRHAGGSYPVHVEAGLLRRLPALLAEASPRRRWVLITDETVAGHLEAWLRAGLAAMPRLEARLSFPPGEPSKTRATWSRLSDEMLARDLDRDTAVLAVGGGVVGDLAGFAAATYQRGVPLIQAPTTLLAQGDSAVGGKTAINHPLGKNMIGAFHQPSLVVSDISTLKTLPDRELSSGLAEVIKYGLIRDLAFLEWLEANLDALLARDAAALSEAIERSCRIKAEIVGRDERESGLRALLNLGHTFGHAIETGLGYGAWLHGEAVAAGMVMAADLSARLGWLRPEEVARVTRLLARAGLPVQGPAGLDEERFLALMAVDKKVQDGKLRLILLRALGEGVICDDVAPELLRATLRQCRASA